MKNRKNIFGRWSVFIMVLMPLFYACKSQKEDGGNAAAANKTLPVNSFIVQPQSFSSEYVTTANILANEQIQVRATISGQVMSINFTEGQYVKKGSPIIRIDDRSWQAQLQGLKAQLLAAESDLERKNKLLEIEGSTLEEVEQAAATVENLKSMIQELEVNIDLANIKAPFSGYLGMRDFSLGAYLNTGDIITTLTETNQLKVDFMIGASFYNSLEIGQEIDVLIEEDTLKASIYTINPQVDVTSRTMQVRARMNANEAKKIMPGIYAEVIIPSETIEDALLIPSEAIVPEIDKQTVYLFKNGKAVRNVVKLGKRTEDKVHVVEGLGKGDTVITSGLLVIKEGMPLQLN